MNDLLKFEVLLDQWRAYEVQVREIYEKQSDLTAAISVAFTDVVRKRQVLALLKWDFSTSGGMVDISCRIKKNDAVWELLNKFKSKKGREYDYQSVVTLGNHHLHPYDSVIRFYFETVDQCMAFCKEQGIKPKSSTLNVRRAKALSEAERLRKLIETLA